MKLSRRNWWFLAIALGALIVFTLLAAPQNNNLNTGSTYSRSPSGYGAWYAFMEKQEIPIKRWQKPLEKLPTINSDRSIDTAMTLLRVNGGIPISSLFAEERKWLEKGNNLVILGVNEPVTEADFTTNPESAFGKVKISTTRRKTNTRNLEQRLGDRFGAIVWEEKLGKGKIIYATTSYLGANAYQDEPGNYKFLAELVSEDSKLILVNEYMHGYKDKETIAEENNESWVSYLIKTPLFPAFLQLVVILLILIWAKQHRFGQATKLTTPSVNNSEAYIQALASVLEKAETREFVLDTIGKEEQLQLQQSLGLGQTLVTQETLINAWVEQTGRTATELEQVLLTKSQKRRSTQEELLNWLEKWQQIRQSILDFRLK
ncbi:hypothetical protein NIES2119_30720 [[Phormidium ambiguum] IAM M-71]|uniref:DUF4350 domain-containing protein n=1 Tax=[Phormidium ambiguum] IAM M-71 TaxID=454136 RepID=A0A1U7I356_9CYAN|nr:DUF4350 domain-containing protein [Phormidium ambiguum]OKH30537.1 hypothetical protein NIES2119_30720 [Phormidium ambiguum IAM M-71]